MNTYNYVKILFCAKIWAMIISISVYTNFKKYLPTVIKQMLTYGKFSYKGKSSVIKPIQVPKSWFKHFYIYSSILISSVLWITIQVYCFHSPPPVWLKTILNYAGGYYREPAVSQIHVLLALTLLTLQCVRRLYDTQYVSVFGKNSVMDIAHYIVGFSHYTGAALAILIEAPIFAVSEYKFELNFYELKLNDYIFTMVFLWAWLHQYKVTVILGNLRKNKKGDVVSQGYSLPKGDLFKYLSSPHSITEILMYFSLTVILWGNITWLFIFFWVLSNQTFTIILSHQWYQETFKDFPENRKAFIPFVY